MYQNVLAWRVAKRLFMLQVAITTILAMFAWIFGDVQAVYSAILGGLVCILPTQLFAYCLLKYSGAQAAKNIMRGLYFGEMAKIGLSIVLFATVFLVFKISAFVFFMTFILVQLVNWFSPLLLRDELSKHEYNHNSDSEQH